MDASQLLAKLRALGDPTAVEGMRRFGISGKQMLGVSAKDLRKVARKIGREHGLAGELWRTGVHEARILAALIDEPEKVTTRQMDTWARQFDSWDICDACCGNLFDKTPFAYRKAVEWSRAKPEFVRRAGYSLMAELVVHDKSAPDSKFLPFLKEIKSGASDERNFVKKSVNWALRQIGKRNRRLNKAAIRVAIEIESMDSRSAKWIAADALRELKSESVARRLRNAA